MVNRLLLFAVAISFTTGAALAVWRGPPQVLAALDDETRDWVRELRNKYGGPCCDTADGYPVEVDGWEGLRSLSVCHAIYESAYSGQPVRVDEVAAGTIDAYQQPIDEHWGLRKVAVGSAAR